MTLLDNLNGPHERGYRDPVVGGFVADSAPFRASEIISELLEALKAVRTAYSIAHIVTGTPIEGSESLRLAEAAIAKAEAAQ